MVTRFWRRLLLLLLAAPLALGANFLRSLLLTLLANEGIDIGGLWHDLTGYGILGGTTLLLIGLGVLLGDRSADPAKEETLHPSTPQGSLPLVLLTLPAVAITLLALVLAFRPNPPPTEFMSPETLLPPLVQGWTVRTDTTLHNYQEVLHTNALLQRDYAGFLADGRPVIINLYVACWAAGKASPSTVALHTPEACWPGEGWLLRPELPQTRADLATWAEQRNFQNPDGRIQYVSYWHLHGNRPMQNLRPRDIWAVMKTSFAMGFGVAKPQLFLRIASERPWSEISNAEPVRLALKAAGISDLPPPPTSSNR